MDEILGEGGNGKKEKVAILPRFQPRFADISAKKISSLGLLQLNS